MDIRLSGRISAEIDGVEVDLGATKSQAVVAALALTPGSPVSTARIIELVWEDDPPRTAEKTLQSYVARLRKSLGDETIERSGDGYRLTVDPQSVDLVAFERLLDEGRSEEALTVWAGAPLPGLGSRGFGPISTRLNERYLGAVESVLGAAIDRGDGPSEIGRLRELVAENPLREGLWALLMQALYQADRQAEALRAYGEARDHLVEGLGIEPGPSLQELERRILEHDPSLKPEAAAAAFSPEPAPDSRSFLFTDIEASTELWSAHNDEMAGATADHDRVIRTAVEEHGGEVFKHTGDGLLAWLPTPSASVNAAVAAQLKLTELTVGGQPLAVRMSVSTGRADQRDDDWFGPPLNIAARLLDAAHGGQILLSGSCHQGLDNQVGPEVATVDLGLLSLRGLSRPERVHQVLHPALPRRFPPLRSLVAHPDNEQPDFPPQLEFLHAVDFVGRDQHVSALHTLWQRIRGANRPGFTLLAGEPGVGKTRLAAAVAESLHTDEGAVVVYGRCAEDHPSPYRPFTEALTAYAEARSDPELRTEIGVRGDMVTPVVPHLLDRFADLERPILTEEDRQLEVFDAVSSFLQVASSSPLVIVLDDIHWADRASLDLLLHLVRHLNTGRLMVMATYRDVEVDRAHPLSKVLADLRREERVERLAVRGVDEVEAVALTEAVLGHELSDAGRQLAAQAGTDAAGNPFFLQEMLRHFMESGVLVRQQGRWTAADAATIQRAVPEGVREVVGRRLDHVSAETNRLLATASALMDDIDVDLLIAVSDMDEDDVLDRLDEALQAGLLVDAARPGRYEFSHALIRQTLYGEFSTARRLRLHRKVGDALVDTGRSDDATVSAIAHHYLSAAAAADPSVVVGWTRKAARRATERRAFEEARDLLDQARDTTDGSLDPDQEMVLLGAWSAVQSRLVNHDAVDDAMRRMNELVDSASTRSTAEAAVEFSRSLMSISFLDELAATLRRLLLAPDLADLEPSLAAALLVERYAAFAVDGLRADEVIGRIGDMDSATLARSFTVANNPQPRDSLLIVREHLIRAAEASGSAAVMSAATLYGFVTDQMAWRQQSFPSVEIERGRDRAEILALILPVVDAQRRGRLDVSADAMARIRNVVDPSIAAWRDRWADYEMDRQLANQLDPRFSRPVGLLSGMVPHVRTELVEENRILELLQHYPSSSHLLVAAELAWEIGANGLAEQIAEMTEPMRGLAGPLPGAQYVLAVDYHLGLLADLMGRPGEAIELHLGALDQSSDAGYLLDVGQIAWHLVRLLGERDGPGDLNLARQVGEDALAALEPTQLVRRKRELNEALATLPS